MKKPFDWIKKNWMSVIALVISLVAAFYTHKHVKLYESSFYHHIEPAIKCMFDFPEDSNPLFVVTNDGDIDVHSLSVMHSIYTFNKNKEELKIGIKAGRELSDRMIYREILRPTERVSQELIRVNYVDPFMAVYMFEVKYYVWKDMQKQSKRELFFIDEGKVYKHFDFKDDVNYKKIMQQIEMLELPKPEYPPGTLKKMIEAWDNK